MTAISESGELCIFAKQRGFVGTAAQQNVSCFALDGSPMEMAPTPA